MPRISRKEKLAEAQDERAPYLWGTDGLPNREDLAPAVVKYVVTGARLLDDNDKVARLAEMLLTGVSVRQIAKVLQVSANSVRAARDSLVREGKLKPFKERAVALFQEIIEGGAATYLEGLDSGTVPVNSIPVAVGIFCDKRALALGEPTAITVAASAPLDRESLSVEALNAWVARLPAARTSDSHSTDTKRIAEENP